MRSRGRKAIVELEWLRRRGYVVERRERHCLEREIKKIEKLKREFWFILKVKTGSQSNG